MPLGFLSTSTWGGKGGELEQVESLSITQAMSKVKDSVQTWGAQNVCLYIEDARQRTWFTGGREKAQGVGSVKRDAQIWEDWCKEQGYLYKMIHPAANATKKKATDFFRMTGWKGRTNEHARDAAMLVFQRLWGYLSSVKYRYQVHLKKW